MAFDNIHLEKGMYHEAGRSFTQVLEQLDPSEGYRGTPLENTDAFQRQLKRFGIRVKGAGSDTVEKFFSTFESAVLFPEFLARAVRQGMDEANILPAITATVTRIDAMDYRSIYSVPEEADRSLAYVAEGASIPATPSARASTSSACTSAAECSWRPMRPCASRSSTCSLSCCARSARRSRPCISRMP